MAAPPGVPADRLAALRRAFDATMKDPAFIAEAEKLQLEIEPMTGGGDPEAAGGRLRDAEERSSRRPAKLLTPPAQKK